MSFEVTVPAFGRDGAGGRLAEWYRPDGAQVSTGELLLRLERDFVAIEVEAQGTGVLRHGAGQGEDLEAGSAAGTILLEGDRLEPSVLAEVHDWPAVEAEPYRPRALPAGALPGAWRDRRPVPLRPLPAAMGSHREPVPLPVAEAPPAVPQAVLLMRVAVGMDEAIKTCSQLAREWAPAGLSPTSGDLLLRAASRALGAVPVGIAAREAVALTGLDGDWRVFREAGSRAFREVVAERQAGGEANETRKAACSVAWLDAWDIDEATPRLTRGMPMALILGAPRETVALEGERPVRRWQAWLSLAYDPGAIADGVAAALLTRTRELLEAPYALLAE